VNDTDGGRLTVANFVEVAITHGGTAPGRIEVLDAKRGSITAGGGDDAIIVRAFSNGPGVGNGFTIAAGGGDDVITLAGHGALSQFRVSAGAGNDRITITGGGADEVNGGDGDDRIDAGGGNDRLTGGAGADLFVFRVGSGRDQVLDFTDGIDRLLFEGVGAAALAFSAVTGGVRVAWGSDEVVLRGAALAGIDLADCVFA
jgi:Ca2+-binding RTX toxin-like protein